MIPFMLLACCFGMLGVITAVIHVVTNWDDEGTECNRHHYKCDKRKSQR